jgi:16S rRNA (cytosine967-C5)-methyltransferase
VPVKIGFSDDPRLVAYQVLWEVQRGKRPEEALSARWALLNGRDRALASALVYDTVRNRSRLDALINLKVSFRTDPKVRLVLQLGLVQLFLFNRVPQFVVVSQTVELAKKVVPGRHKLVNAVLRSWTREKETAPVWPMEPAPPGATAVERLAVFYSHPVWLVEKMVASLGFRAARALAAANNVPVPPTIRINPLKTTREMVADLLPFSTKPTPWSPWGLVPESSAGPPENWPGYAEGLWAIQDEASQILGLLVGEPKTILDACAGLGGKSLAVAALSPEAELICVDRNSAALEALKQEAQRLGLPKMPTVAAIELNDPAQALPGGPFDLVVLDAPCSGLGVIRRRPDIKWSRKPGDISVLAETQLKLLFRSADLVAAGGRLIYCVCTTTDEEGPEVLEQFFKKRSDFLPLSMERLEPALKKLFHPPASLRLFPHLHGTDGFFYGLAEKKS